MQISKIVKKIKILFWTLERKIIGITPIDRKISKINIYHRCYLETLPREREREMTEHLSKKKG